MTKTRRAMKRHRVAPEARCTACGYVTDGAAHPYDDAAVPTPGDVSVCCACAAVLVFTHDLTTRAATREEVEGLPFALRMQVEKLRTVVAQAQGGRVKH